jgi:hypothetical protein
MVVIQFSISGIYETLPLLDFRKEKGKRVFISCRPLANHRWRKLPRSSATWPYCRRLVHFVNANKVNDHVETLTGKEIRDQLKLQRPGVFEVVSLAFFLGLIYLYLGVAMAVAYRVKNGPYPSDFAVQLLLTWPRFLWSTAQRPPQRPLNLREFSMTNEELVTVITDEVRNAIAALPTGEILTSSEAFEFAKDIVTKDALDRGMDIATAEFRKHARDIYFLSYASSRKLVAEQLIGITFEQAIETTVKAVLRFLGQPDLKIVPRPTLAYSGECEPHDIWNLLSNSFHAMKAAEENKAALSSADRTLLQDLRRSEQLLHMISQNDVLREDVQGKTYDGNIREQA